MYVGCIAVVLMHLIAYQMPEALGMAVFWGSFVAVGAYVGRSSRRPFYHGALTGVVGMLASWAIVASLFREVPDERDLFAGLMFLLPITALLAGTTSAATARFWRAGGAGGSP